MSAVLKEQIESRMRAKKLSIPQLERMAGLKIHAVRNILKGRIKNPTAENLRAIANVLEQYSGEVLIKLFIFEIFHYFEI